MRVKWKHPNFVIRCLVATLLLAGSSVAVTHHPQHRSTPVVMGTISPAQDVSAYYAQKALEATQEAEAEQRALQEAEAARLAQIAAQKARASRAPRIRPTQPPRGVMPTIAQADELGSCECSRNAQCNTGNGFYGAFQFMLRTWQRFRPGNPINYTYEQQREVILTYFPISSWPSQFPGCYRKLHARGIV